MSVSLLDIGRLERTVVVRGAEFKVTGISARDLFRLLDSFPELRRLLSGAVEARPEMLFEQAPGAISTLIAYVLGHHDDPAAEREAIIVAIDNLMLGEQAEIVKTAWELTFPRGVSSFFEALEAMGVGTGSTKGLGTTSQERSKNSLPQDTEPMTSGDTPPDSSPPI